jgi:cytochrome c biogenesis protein CcdA
MLNNLLANVTAGIDATTPSAMIPLVITAGLLDGFSPCVIAILIFFIAFLVSLQRTFKNIFFLGLVYIFVVFLTYLSVGVGLFSGIMLFGRHHFFAELGSWFLILWGGVQIKDYFFPKLPPHFRMPKVAGQKAKGWLEKATLFGVIVAAFLVGLCSVPCSAGIYTAVTSLLASSTTYFTGFLYLLLYNFMVIVPLLVLLGLAVNPFTLGKLAEFRQKHERTEKLVMGLAMVILGVGILIFFI